MSSVVNNSTLMIAAGATTYYPIGYPAVTRFDGTNAIAANTWAVPILVQNTDRLSIHVSCPSTGSPNGTLSLLGSNDVGLYEALGTPFSGGPAETGGTPISDPQIVNWATLGYWNEATAVYAPAGFAVAGATSAILTLQQCAARWIFVAWVNTSGSAKLTIRVQQKSIGGR